MKVCIAAVFLTVAFSAPVFADPATIPLANLPTDIQQKILALAAPRGQDEEPLNSVVAFAELQEAKAEIAESLLGLGFDMWTGRTVERCVTPDSILFEPGHPSGINLHNVRQYREINTLQQHHENRSSGANVSITYDLVSFGLGTGGSDSSTFKSTSRYLDFYGRYVGDEYYALGGTETEAASSSIGVGTERFAEVCGQRYVSRVGFGLVLDAQLAAIIEIGNDTGSDQTEVGIGFGDLLGFGANSQETVTKISEHSSLSVVLAGSGGVMPKPAELLEYVRQFGATADIAASFQQVYVEVTPYNKVNRRMFSTFADLVEDAAGTVLEFQFDQRRARQQVTDLQDAMDNPRFLGVSDPSGPISDLDAAMDERTDYLDALSDLYNVCKEALTDVKVLECRTAADTVGNGPGVLFFDLRTNP